MFNLKQLFLGIIVLICFLLNGCFPFNNQIPENLPPEQEDVKEEEEINEPAEEKTEEEQEKAEKPEKESNLDEYLKEESPWQPTEDDDLMDEYDSEENQKKEKKNLLWQGNDNQ